MCGNVSFRLPSYAPEELDTLPSKEKEGVFETVCLSIAPS